MYRSSQKFNYLLFVLFSRSVKVLPILQVTALFADFVYKLRCRGPWNNLPLFIFDLTTYAATLHFIKVFGREKSKIVKGFYIRQITLLGSCLR